MWEIKHLIEIFEILENILAFFWCTLPVIGHLAAISPTKKQTDTSPNYNLVAIMSNFAMRVNLNLVYFKMYALQEKFLFWMMEVR